MLRLTLRQAQGDLPQGAVEFPPRRAQCDSAENQGSY